MRLGVLIAGACFVTGAAYAQPMTLKVLTDKAGCGTCVWLQASGEITSETAQQFKSFLSDNPFVSVVQLDSVGGNLKAALEIGQVIRSRDLITVVGGAAIALSANGDRLATRVAGTCASACVYMLAAGRQRTQVRGSSIGVHQFSGTPADISGDDALDVGQRTTGALIEYLSRMDVDPLVIAAGSTASPKSVYVLSDTEALRFRLLTSLQEQFSVSPGYGRVAAVTGSDPFGDSPRVPPSSRDECGKARYSLSDSNYSTTRMQEKNRFFREACEAYFDSVEDRFGGGKRECQPVWDAVYDELQTLGATGGLPLDLRMASLKYVMSLESMQCLVNNKR